MAVAQTAPPAEASGADSAASEAQGGDIVVTGIRQSLSRAAEIKRESTAVVDSIVAEDIGKLPDLTTASALQRVPGMHRRSEERCAGKECVSSCISRAWPYIKKQNQT